VILAWISNTVVRPASKKAAAIGIINAMGNIGSIPGSYVWPSKWGPYYVKSFGAEVAIFAFALACAFTLRMYLRLLNKKLDEGEAAPFEVSGTAAEQTAHLEGKPTQEIVEEAKRFRYLY
jgi:hypothetical protein